MSLDAVPSDVRSPELIVNANNLALDPMKLFGYHVSTTGGLWLGLYGGNLMIADVSTPLPDTLTLLAASNTNYVEATTAGAVSANTTGFSVGRIQIGIAVTSATAITSWTDKRTSGIGGGLSASGSAVFDFKQSVRAATTANITLSGAQTIDGVSVIAGNRVLVKAQSTGANNGIYVCAAGTWPRATDADVSASVTGGMFVVVNEGTVNADTAWVLTTNDPITLGSTALTFAQFAVSAAPSGAAGGDLAGSYPNPTIKASVSLTTPILNVATATSINKVAITAPATSATLTIADGKTLTVSNSLTLAGTDATVMTFPPATASIGYLGIPQNSQSANYTTVLADNGKHIYHPSADTTARTWTIDSNANSAQPIGAAITFVNDNGAGVITIAITSDTLRLAGTGTTGSRSLAANGCATAIKMTSTSWQISGTGLT